MIFLHVTVRCKKLSYIESSLLYFCIGSFRCFATQHKCFLKTVFLNDEQYLFTIHVSLIKTCINNTPPPSQKKKQQANTKQKSEYTLYHHQR